MNMKFCYDNNDREIWICNIVGIIMRWKCEYGLLVG